MTKAIPILFIDSQVRYQGDFSQERNGIYRQLILSAELAWLFLKLKAIFEDLYNDHSLNLRCINDDTPESLFCKLVLKLLRKFSSLGYFRDFKDPRCLKKGLKLLRSIFKDKIILLNDLRE